MGTSPSCRGAQRYSCLCVAATAEEAYRSDIGRSQYSSVLSSYRPGLLPRGGEVGIIALSRVKLVRSLREEHLDVLAGALALNGVLPALRILTVDGLTKDTMGKLARPLAGGALPQLEVVSLSIKYDKRVLDALADALEARTRLPGCKGLGTFLCDFDLEYFWLGDEFPLATRVRLLRALLPSICHLPEFEWDDAYETCFQDIEGLNLNML